MIKLLFLLTSIASAQNTNLKIDGRMVEVTKVSQAGESVTAAVLKNTQALTVGRNTFAAVPAGSRLSFFTNSGAGADLKLRGFIITKKTPDQTVKLKSNKIVSVNCGRFEGSVAFIVFSEGGELLSGCHSTTEQRLPTSLSNSTVKALQGSGLYFLENGLLKLASKASGQITVEGNLIELKYSTSLGFHDNGKLHFLHPKEGTAFALSTEISEITNFHQPYADKTYPIFFHKNQKISSAVLNLEEGFTFRMEAFGTEFETELISGPVGFDEKGMVNRTVLSKNTKIKVSTPTFVRRTEQSTGAVVRGQYPVAAEAQLVKGTQLFLKNTGEQSVLIGYPEFGIEGLAFFHELSYSPF